MMTKRANGSIKKIDVRCISNEGYPASLKVGKVYKAMHCDGGWLAVYDESKDTYGYPSQMFEIVDES